MSNERQIIITTMDNDEKDVSEKIYITGPDTTLYILASVSTRKDSDKPSKYLFELYTNDGKIIVIEENNPISDYCEISDIASIKLTSIGTQNTNKKKQYIKYYIY